MTTDAVRSAVREPSGEARIEDLADLHTREIDQLVACLFSGDRALGMAGAEELAEQAFLDLRRTWPGTGAYPSHPVQLFATAQRIASSWPRRSQADAPDPLKDSAPDYWDRADVARLTVLQDSLDRLPDIPRHAVLLREMRRFSPAETAQIMSVPESAVENARGDGLRALVPMIEAGTSSGQARRGPLVPEDFAALRRVLQVDDGRVAAARSRFAASLVSAPRNGAGPRNGTGPRNGAGPGFSAQTSTGAGGGSGSGRGSGAQVAPAASRGPAQSARPRPGSTPPPPTVAPVAPPTAAFRAPARSGPVPDTTRVIPAAGASAPAPPPAASTTSPSRRSPATPAPGTSQRYGVPLVSGPPSGRPAPQPLGQGQEEGVGSGAGRAPTSPPAPTYQAPAPTYQAPAPIYQAPAPIYQAPAPIYQAPAPTYQAPAPTYQAPAPTYQAPSPLDLGSLLGVSTGSLNIGTPIFDSVSAWFSSGGASAWASMGDEAWQEASRRAAAAPTIEGSTTAGLPRRRPGANTVPSASEAMSQSSMFGPPSDHLDAGAVRSRLGGFQDGLRSARRERDEFPEPSAVEAVPALEVNGNVFRAPMETARSSGGARLEVPTTPAAPRRPPETSRTAGVPDDDVMSGTGEPTEGRSATRRHSASAANGEEASSSASESRPSEARGFGAFYRDYLPQLLAVLMVEGARPAAAAEIAQDVMSAAYRDWARIDKPRDWTRARALAAWADRREG